MIRASVNLMPEAPVREMVALAIEAERLGFERCWVYDEGLATRDVYVTMTAIALATGRMKIGPGITNAYTRHVSQTAAAIASLDELSVGRAVLGLGAGGSLTLGPLAMDRSRPLAAVRATIEGCRGLFSGLSTSYDSSVATLREARLTFARPDIEIWLAGRGPKMLALGGEIADGVMLDFMHRDAIADTVAIVRRAARAAGRPMPKLSYSTMMVTDDDSINDVKPHLTYRLVDSQPKVRELLGISESDIDRIRDGMADGLVAAGRFIKDEWVLPFVIHGSKADCAAQLSALMTVHGFDEYLLPVLDPHTGVEEMTRLAEVVAGAAR